MTQKMYSLISRGRNSPILYHQSLAFAIFSMRDALMNVMGKYSFGPGDAE